MMVDANMISVIILAISVMLISVYANIVDIGNWLYRY